MIITLLLSKNYIFDNVSLQTSLMVHIILGIAVYTLSIFITKWELFRQVIDLAKIAIQIETKTAKNRISP
jgi:hypothetical protein